MQDVYVIAVGQIPVREHWTFSLRQLGIQAIQAMLLEHNKAKPEVIYVANAYAPLINFQNHLGPLFTEPFFPGVESVTISAGGASGAAAFRQAVLAISSGQVKSALVLGVEQYSDQVSSTVNTAISADLDAETEAIHGLTPAGQAAIIMQRYLTEYHLDHEVLAGFPVTAHENAAANPIAMFQRAISIEIYKKSGLSTSQLNLFDSAPQGDGAAAIFLSSEPNIGQGGQTPILVAASSAASDKMALHDRENILEFKAVTASTEAVLSGAGLSLDNIDLFELFDAYSIFAALVLESAGFAEKGAGWKLAGKETGVPYATLGGLKARGDVGGATGVYQLVEAVLQLRGEAGAAQVTGAKTALVQSLGGPASTVVTHILQKEAQS
ncbi:MAG: thiolase domain-containing protein [Anaerolineales bacterium]|nr:thiolase domain-containing protein [Anaerolineales bacterium]